MQLMHQIKPAFRWQICNLIL